MGFEDERVLSLVRVFASAMMAIVALGLGLIQALSSVALRERARGAWIDLVPAPIADAVDRLDPALPLPDALRLVFARAALDARDLARVRAETARLHPSPDRFALEAALALARGDTDAALEAYLAAGDLAGFEARVDGLAASGRTVAALVLQRRMIARLARDRTQADVLAEAAFDLGRLEEQRAYAFAVGSAERHRYELRALDAYLAASRAAPLAERYLLALGNQQLNLARLDAAVATFERAREADPTSADPIAGLGDAAARRGDARAARVFLARARALDGRSPAVERLAHEIGD
ncbi:MAG: hypothetical protein NVSMB21_04780 [Vulcanimicrobiaceae bacterium]